MLAYLQMVERDNLLARIEELERQVKTMEDALPLHDHYVRADAFMSGAGHARCQECREMLGDLGQRERRMAAHLMSETAK